MKHNRYDTWVRSQRPAGNRPLPPTSPIATDTAVEMLPDGKPGRVGTVYINSRECPYSCIFCGLWQNMVEERPTPGNVVEQIERSLAELGEIDAVKLYNAGSFFDEGAILPADLPEIARLCRALRWTIVESRPELIDERAARFASLLDGGLEVAIGLEAADDRLLAMLNKRMTLASFDRGARFLRRESIGLRAFIMIKPPFVSEGQAGELAGRTVRFALDHGATTLSLIATYSTPGAMERLQRQGYFIPPRLPTIYDAARNALSGAKGRAAVIVDTDAVGALGGCNCCGSKMRAALREMNASQRLARVTCPCREDYLAIRRTECVRGIDEFRAELMQMLRSARPEPVR